jgi:hypothetical protein
MPPRAKRFSNFATAERPKMYAAAYLLLPKTERYAPELSQSIISAMQQLVSDVPPELTQEAAYSNFKANLNRDLDDSLKAIEKERNAQKRDEQYLILIADLRRQPDLARAQPKRKDVRRRGPRQPDNFD